MRAVRTQISDGQGWGGQDLTSGELLSTSPAPLCRGGASESWETFSSSSSWMGDDGDRKVLRTEKRRWRTSGQEMPTPPGVSLQMGARVHRADAPREVCTSAGCQRCNGQPDQRLAT